MAIAYVYVTLAYSKGNQAADQEHQGYYAERAAYEDRYRTCLGTAPTIEDARSCIEDAPATPREAERAEQDLNAQREMADWAEGMLWATGIIGLTTIAITAIGVWYVKRTLDATLRAIGEAERGTEAAVHTAEITRQIGEIQTRAWLAPADIIVASMRPGTDQPIAQIVMHFPWQNFGDSPALDVRFAQEPHVGDARGFNPKKPFDELDWSGSAFTLAPNTPPSFKHPLVFSPEEIIDLRTTPLRIRIAAAYRTVYDIPPTPFRVSEAAFKITFRGTHSVADIQSNGVGPEHFMFENIADATTMT